MIGSEVPWIWITDGGFGGLQAPSWVAGHRPDRGEQIRLAGQREGHHPAVADAGRIDPGRVDRYVGADIAHHAGEEADVVDVLPAGVTAATGGGVPRLGDTIGVGDDELRGVGQLVPPELLFGIGRGAGQTVHDDHQRGRRQAGPRACTRGRTGHPGSARRLRRRSPGRPPPVRRIAGPTTARQTQQATGSCR